MILTPRNNTPLERASQPREPRAPEWHWTDGPRATTFTSSPRSARPYTATAVTLSAIRIPPHTLGGTPTSSHSRFPSHAILESCRLPSYYYRATHQSVTLVRSACYELLERVRPAKFEETAVILPFETPRRNRRTRMRNLVLFALCLAAAAARLSMTALGPAHSRPRANTVPASQLSQAHVVARTRPTPHIFK